MHRFVLVVETTRCISRSNHSTSDHRRVATYDLLFSLYLLPAQDYAKIEITMSNLIIGR